MKKSDLALTLPQRLILLFCIFLVCYILTIAGSYVLGRLLEGNLAKALRISAVLQDILTFIIPAVVTALMVTRRPAELLGLLHRPSVMAIIYVTAILFISIPLQENIIYWNYHIELPESLSAFEEAARKMEDAAFGTMKTLLADTSVLSLIVGFVPRMLLGAYFGYLLVWTGSVWVPVAAHILNNMMFVVTAWQQARLYGPDTIDNEPSQWPWAYVALSAIGSALCIYCIYRLHGASGRKQDKK